MATFLRIITAARVCIINLDGVADAVYYPMKNRTSSSTAPEALLVLHDSRGERLTLIGAEARAAAATLGLHTAAEIGGVPNTSLLSLGGDTNWVQIRPDADGAECAEGQ